jgi:hypothetical protein
MTPELCIGLNVLTIAAGGLTFAVLKMSGLTASDGVAFQVPRVIGLLFVVAHIPASFATSWKIFRPTKRWAGALVGVATLLGFVWLFLSLRIVSTDPWVPSMLLGVVRGGGMAWAAFECFRYSATLRKRAVLGLADPMIAHRIWLWGWGAVATMVGAGLNITSWIMRDDMFSTTQFGANVNSFLALAGASAIAFAFFPPSRYERFIQRRYALEGEQA